MDNYEERIKHYVYIYMYMNGYSYTFYYRLIIVLLDQSVTTTLYICVLFMNNPIRGNLHTLHCHAL